MCVCMHVCVHACVCVFGCACKNESILFFLPTVYLYICIILFIIQLRIFFLMALTSVLTACTVVANTATCI